MSRMKAPVLTAVAGVLACGYVYAVDPAEPGHYPPCPLKVMTGLDCPFCGGLRSTHELLHGNVGAAIDLNAFTTLFVIPVALVVFVVWSYRRWRGEPFELTVPTWVSGAVAVLALAFMVVRNIPGMPLGSST